MRRIVMVVMSAVLASSSIVAQSPPASTPTALEMWGQSDVGVGSTIRIVMPGEGRVSGKVMALDASALTLSTDGGQRVMQVLPDTLWRRQSSAWKGAKIGAAIGIPLGVLAGLAGQSMCTGLGESSSNCGSPGAVAVAGGLLFGAAGMGLGALVGAPFQHWQRRVP